MEEANLKHRWHPDRMEWWRVAGILLAFKVCYLVGIYIALKLWASFDVQQFHSAFMQWPREGTPVFASHFATWDAAHYLYLSEAGYRAGDRSCAFYPLWPYCIRWLGGLPGVPDLAAGMILANGFSWAALVLFFVTARRRFGGPVAAVSTALLIIFPGALFFQFIYSEPLFFLLAMAIWYGLETNRSGLVCVAAFLIPLSRPIGVFTVLPIAWYAMVQRPPEWLRRLIRGTLGRLNITREWVGSISQGTSGLSAPVFGSLLLAPLLGWAGYFLLMGWWTGNPIEGIQAQRHWGVHSIFNLIDIPGFLASLFAPTQFHAFRGSMLDRIMFVLLCYCVVGVWNLGKDMMIWLYILGIVPAMSGHFTSFTRFESVAFPLFIAIAVFFLRRKSRWPMIGFAIAMAALHGLLLWRFVNFQWAG